MLSGKETVVGGEEDRLNALKRLHERHALLDPQRIEGGRERIGEEGALRDDRGADDLIDHWVSGGGVQDVVVSLPLEGEEALIRAAGDQAGAIELGDEEIGRAHV